MSKRRLSLDVVEASAAKFDIEVPPRVLARTKEDLRILQTKAAMRLDKLDTPDTRAAILLLYNLRESSSVDRSVLDTKEIARKMGFKYKSFEQFYTILGNYRTRKEPKAVSRQARFTRSALPAPESILPLLSIRLGTSAPVGTGDRAKKLMREIQAHMEGFSANRKRDSLSDLNKNRTTYEAACFFLAASRENPTTTISHQDDNAEEPVMDMDDVVNATPGNPSLHTFKNILAHIRRLHSDIEREKLASKKKTRKRQLSRQQDIAENLGAPKEPPSNKKKAITDDTASALTSHETAGDTQDPRPESMEQNPELKEWREKTLQEAREEAREEMRRDGVTGDISDSAALAHAATSILRARGLIQ